MQNQSFIWSFHMTMWKVHMNNECMTACLIQLSACSSNDIDALINPGGKEVTYLWPMVMMKPMALYVIYPGSCGPFQYSEGYVKIAALKLICVTYTNWIICLWDKKIGSNFNFQVFNILFCATTFYQREGLFGAMSVLKCLTNMFFCLCRTQGMYRRVSRFGCFFLVYIQVATFFLCSFAICLLF